MGTYRVLPEPQLVGLAPVSAASAWGFGSWVLVQQTAGESSIMAVSYQWTSAPTADTTEETLLEIGTGASGSQTTQLQFPHSHRSDTAVGYYLKPTWVVLPEPFAVTAGTALWVRAADSSTSARTYQGFRIMYDQITPAGPQTFGRQINQAVNRAAVI